MRKIARLLCFVVLSAVLAGCASGVGYTIDPGYGEASPARIAVLPAIIEEPVDAGDRNIGEIFRAMSYERLREMNYSPVPLDEIDRLLGKDWRPADKAPRDIARLLGADAVLYIRVAGWDKDRMPAYASLEVEGSYELYSSDGRRLWSASHSTEESDFGLDGEAMEAGVLNAYEPRIQRFVDDVLSTLPHREAQRREKEKFYQWLP